MYKEDKLLESFVTKLLFLFVVDANGSSMFEPYRPQGQVGIVFFSPAKFLFIIEVP